MTASRIAGFTTVGLVLSAAALLGAPASLLAWFALAMLSTAFFPGGVGAAAITNLAQKRYDRSGWRAGWSDHYLE